MPLFSRPETVVLKEGSSSRQQLAALEELRGTLPSAAGRQLEADIRNLRAGIVGEDRIMYELKNSHMDMVILQDLFLEHDGLTAQIDFLVLTPRRSFVLECKNLYGNIEVNNRGDFVRTFAGGKKEGIYSPIAQNRRHLDLTHAMRRDSRGTLMNLLVDRDFDDIYRSLVVLANPKTVLNDRFAKREVKERLVRADQLIDTIRAINGEKGPGHEKTSMAAVRERAEWFLARYKECPTDYVQKYREMTEGEGAGVRAEKGAGEAAGVEVATGGEEPARAPVACDPPVIKCPICGSPMVLRTAKRGARAGKQFFGCSRFPTCHGILNVGE